MGWHREACLSAHICCLPQEWYEEHAREQEEQRQLLSSTVPTIPQPPGSRQRSQTVT